MSVVVTSPTAGATVAGSITVTAQWSGDPTKFVTATMTVDGTQVGNQDQIPPLAFPLDTTKFPDGTHKIAVHVQYRKGSRKRWEHSADVNVNVDNVVTPPPPPPPTPTGYPLPALRSPTIFCAGDGSDVAAGTLTAPLSLKGAVSKSQPGDVIGLLGDRGPFMRNADLYPHGGTPSEWIQYRPVADHGVPVIKGQGGANNYNGFVPNGAAYLDFRGIIFDGSLDLKLAQGLHSFNGAHHIIVAYCRSVMTGSSGIITTSSGTGNQCDYIWIVGCDSWRFGDGAGWSSSVSYNNQGRPWWFDQAPGFHNFIVGNRFCGGIDMSVDDSDGNGIILDLYGAGAPILIGNNLVYMNGGRGIQCGAGQGVVTNAKVYVVNNTVWKNGLDLRKGPWMEMGANLAENEIWANLIAIGSTNSRPYWLLNNSKNITGIKNLGFGGQPSSGFTPQYTVDPRFAWVPQFSEGQANQWKNPPKPWELPANAFRLRADSPVLTAGVDPMSLPGLDATMLQQMQDWMGQDAAGNPRGDSSCSLGCYEGAAV